MITVLGATGNVGSKVAAQLLAQNEDVRVVGRDSAKLSSQFKGADVKAGDLKNTAFVTEVLKGATSAFIMIPPDYTTPDFGAHYKQISESLVRAIQESGIKHVVNLSSYGAELEEGTGPVKHLHAHEKRLNRLEGVHVLHLRPTGFMENQLMNIPLIQAQSLMGSHQNGALKTPMIATADIAQAAAKALIELAFKNKSVQELLGPEDISLDEAAEIVSEQVGKPVKYMAFDAASTKQALVGMGLSADVAGLFVEMGAAWNSGLLKPKARTAASTTPTTFAKFAAAFRS